MAHAFLKLPIFLLVYICAICFKFMFVSSLQLSLSTKAPLQQTVKKPLVVIGGIFPHSTLNSRFYKNDVFQGHLKTLPKSTPFLQHYELLPDVQQVTVALPDSSYPMDVIQALCGVLVPKRVTAIIYVSASEKYGKSTASSQYLLHMISNTGIPIIAWNADSSGLLVNRDFAKYRLLQMAPPLEHQVQAMLKLLERYGWSKFAVITTTISGYQHFLHLLREETINSSRKFKLELVTEIIVDAKNASDIEHKLGQLFASDGRIFLFYATHAEAEIIFPVAKQIGLTNEDYLWIGTQSVVANFKNRPISFQQGMLAVHFDTSTRYRPSLREQTENVLVSAIRNAVDVLVAGLNLLVSDYNNTLDLLSTASCDTDVNYTWPTGDILYKYLKNVSTNVESGDPQRPKLKVKFDKNGKLAHSYLSIVNLKPNRNWEKVGYFTNELGIYDITWPGRETSPPKGTPEKYHIKVVTLEESPFIMFNDMPPQSDACPGGQTVCRWNDKDEIKNVNFSTSSNASVEKCCSGFGVDLLNKLANDIGFGYDLYRVEDGKWGIKENGTWNGLVADLVTQKADMCVSALVINSDRQKDIDFSVPFHETGIAILVALRRGALSPTAFLEPFEYSTWIFMLVVVIQASAFAIFVFEWLSPQSYNMAKKPPPGHRFSLLRAYWLVWATFFSTSVNTDIPRSHTSRFMALVWAAFAMTFLAVYTANLAAFMITRTEYYDLTGINDPRITNPKDFDPVFKFCTILGGNTESTLKKNYRNVYKYIAKENKFFQRNVSAAVAAVKTREYDAFIYDAVVLEYISAKDDYCDILTTGKWFSMTGYGIGFPKNSKWLAKTNKQLLKYQERGDLSYLRNFWFPGSCSVKKSRDHMKHSTPLGIENFVSAFVLLAGGTAVCLIVLGLEYFFWYYIRPRLAKFDKSGWCGLISLSMARSFSFREVVAQAHADFKIQKETVVRVCSTKPQEDKETEKVKLPTPSSSPSTNRQPQSMINRFQDSGTASGGQCYYAALENLGAIEEKCETEMEF